MVPAAIPSPAFNELHAGPLAVHVYGLMYVVAIAAAIAIGVRRWEAQGGDRALVYEVAVWGVIAGLIGGRLYHVITSFDELPPHWWGAFAIWKGGLGIWGGVAGGVLAAVVVLRRRGASVARFMDAGAPALLVAQAIGRIGNWFNQELFGAPTSLPWGLRIDPAHRPDGYGAYTTFQPTFLYEIVWNVGLAGALVWLGHRRRIRAPGLFALYVCGYSLGRIGEELLRIDPAHHVLGMRLNFWVALLLCLAGALWFAASQGWLTRRATTRGAALLLAGGSLVAACGCGHGGHGDPGAVAHAGAAVPARAAPAGPGPSRSAALAGLPSPSAQGSGGRRA